MDFNKLKIYDISQPVFDCEIYPGDPKPEKILISSTANNDPCNITKFMMCAHNGTHIDSPNHFINNGKTIDKIPLNKLVGACYVKEFNGEFKEIDARNLINEAKNKYNGSEKKLLLKGDLVVSIDAAKYLALYGIDLIGNEAQTIGPLNAPMAVHLELLGKDIVMLEGIRLNNIKEGVYFLNTAPINLNGCDGAPCRTILIDFLNTNGE